MEREPLGSLFRRPMSNGMASSTSDAQEAALADGLVDSFPGTAGTSYVFEFTVSGHTDPGYLVIMGANSKFFWSKEDALAFAQYIADHGWSDEGPPPPPMGGLRP